MRQIEARRPWAAGRRTSPPYGSYDCWIIADMSSQSADSLQHGDMKRTPCGVCCQRLQPIGKRPVMNKMNSVVHFEMPYDDRERMAKFYQKAFGWQTQTLEEEMGNYVLATTTERNESGPISPGTINGGFFQRNPDWPAQH